MISCWNIQRAWFSWSRQCGLWRQMYLNISPPCAYSIAIARCVCVKKTCRGNARTQGLFGPGTGSARGVTPKPLQLRLLPLQGASQAPLRPAARTSFNETMKGCRKLLWCTISRFTYVLKFLTCAQRDDTAKLSSRSVVQEHLAPHCRPANTVGELNSQSRRAARA